MTLPDDWRHDREIGAQPGATLDTTRVDDVRIGAVRPLISPALLLDDMPAPDSARLNAAAALLESMPGKTVNEYDACKVFGALGEAGVDEQLEMA